MERLPFNGVLPTNPLEFELQPTWKIGTVASVKPRMKRIALEFILLSSETAAVTTVPQTCRP
jgi:hypothetical protein